MIKVDVLSPKESTPKHKALCFKDKKKIENEEDFGHMDLVLDQKQLQSKYQM